MPRTKLFILATVSLGTLVGLTFGADAQSPPPRPASPQASEYSGTFKRADADMRKVLEAHQGLNPKPLAGLSPEEARRQPSPADAVKALLREQGKDPDALMAQMKVKKQDITYSGPSGDMPARVYTPENAGPGPLPVVVFFHGGGWVIADIDTYESSAMALARKANAIVVSVEYRRAPEHKFPAAHEDAVSAYSWVLKNAQSFGGDPTRVAVAGESAGGNLAINVAMTMRDGQGQQPAHMLLIYPVAGTNMQTPSYRENADAKPLNRAGMQWFVQNATNGTSDLEDPKLDVVGKANLRDLPDATIITAEIDPLQSEGRQLADKLKAAGSKVTYQDYDGVTHEFFGMDAVVADADKAQDLAARELRQAFSPRATGSTRGESQKKQ